MELTKKQLKDLETIKYFIPRTNSSIKITNDDIVKFFEYSEQGLHKQDVNAYKGDGFNTLIQGKRWRGIHMQMYEDGVLDGSMPYFIILGGYDNDKKWWQFWKSPHKPMPRAVVDFLKKEMFKGVDADLIEEIYQYICK